MPDVCRGTAGEPASVVSGRVRLYAIRSMSGVLNEESHPLGHDSALD